MAKNKKLNILDTNIFKKKIFLTKTPEETRSLGKNFATVLKSGDIVFLNGDLGSGKTTFVQGVVKAFGNKGFARSSSFMLVNEYDANNLKLFHMDLYRLDSLNIWEMALEDYLYSNNISLIEWANRLSGFENYNNWNIEIETIGQKRRIKIKKNENFSNRNFRKNI
ncbi:MAG: tRNA (adenosine(37)-N6)-threonylcarbamoyltransferase complex ATPase subunit type 1 TsaE [Endomicrobium sp.]|jgi:tRNA threonylcarbamoyladenosine biosynthesis protein TsaE|nr:tRNA (adenosine(37)-N6)-threonylcarbamoyltransferase complex ATPase subunit type 1 TsaE [Endomicrobium sp.]